MPTIVSVTSTAWPRPSGSPWRTYETLDQVRDLADFVGEILLAAALEKRLELLRHVEVILDRVLAAAGDDDDVRDAGVERFLDAVLNGRLVDERQHLLGLRLGGWEKTGAEAGGGEDGLTNRRLIPLE